MFKLLAQLWRWLKRWFIRQPPPPPPPTQPSDLDYENVVLALLAEVAQGKTWGQLQAFLMNRNVNQQRLAAWLQEFGQRWLAQPEVHQELARRLRRLGEMAHGELARVARELAEGLLVVPEPDNSVITESAIAGGNEQGASLSEVEKLNQLLAGLKGSGYNQESVPVSNSAIVSDAKFWFNQGVTLSELGRNEEALINLDQAISLLPDSYQVCLNRGVVLSKLGRNEEAVASFEQAISLQPDSHQAWYNLSVVLSDLERNEEALVICEQAISIQPDFYQAWVQRGIAARNSLGSETFWQQNFVACFRSKCNKFANVLIPTLQNTNRERHLALFQASLHSSIALLKETFADSPKVIAQLEQPPSPKLSQIIQQPPSQTLIDFIQKPLSEEVIAKIAQDSLNHPSLIESECVNYICDST